MFILTIRTDKPKAELGLYDNQKQLTPLLWEAHRQLAESLHTKIREALTLQSKELKDLEGVVVYKGPGSFTGLRIGISVANALASSLRIPLVGGAGSDWQTAGCERLLQGEDDKLVVPEYGAPPHITQQKR